jgi:integrase
MDANLAKQPAAGSADKKHRRESHTGRICERPKSKFLWVQYYVAGEQIRASTKTANLRKAKKFLRERLAEVITDTHADSRKIRYEDIRDGYMTKCQTSSLKSLRHDAKGVPYLEAVRRLDTYFSGMRVADIDTDLLEKFQLKLRSEGYADGTINRSMSSLRRAFTLAQRKGKIKNAPFFPQLPEAPPRKDKLPDEDQYMVLVAALPEYVRLPLSIAYHTGMRSGEIKSLKWSENVNFMDKFISIEDSKGGDAETGETDPRVIPFGDELEGLLKAQYAKRQAGCEYVCFRIDRKGKARPLGNFRKVWITTCIKLGLGKTVPAFDSTGAPIMAKPRKDRPGAKAKQAVEYKGLLFHGLRRTFITDAENAGVPRHEAMRLSGHRTESVYKRYAVENLDRRRAELGRMKAYRRKQVEAHNEHTAGTEGNITLPEPIVTN